MAKNIQTEIEKLKNQIVYLSTAVQENMQKAVISDGSGTIQAVWFNQPFLATTAGRNLLAAGIILLILAGYLIFTLLKLFRPPPLIIDQPQEAQELASPVLIKGKTDRDATLTLNNKIVNLEPDGRFTTIYSTQSGTLELNFTATSRRGKTRELVRHGIITP